MKNVIATVEFEGQTYTDVVDGVVVPHTGVDMLATFITMAASLTGLVAVVFTRKKH